ncbi:IPT/TIG domain-containing protein [Reichenbachiella ulvae]|uniref:IPT/TIG domain-containing protein n=1 Tax=Reichenbachiella ulvae TaxID=2980104 RepID=A0ABT3CSQ6_9BACT|nr:IPT/TIG domain-containing protein [Reichenbachiella ulvae]MCV9386741.1 IPT/TIG domain-containing protein [Reichenbachiella ulvae]
MKTNFHFREYLFIWMLLFLIGINLSCEETEPEIPILLLQEISNLDEDGVLVEGKISNVSHEDILSFGAVWSFDEELPSLANAIIDSLKPAEFREKVSFEINTLAKDSTYQVRLFVKTKSNVFYSNARQFLSLGSTPPEILDVEPKKAFFRDTVMIHGTDFGKDPEAVALFFGNTKAPVLSQTDSTIQTVVPILYIDNQYFNSGELPIKVSKYNIESDGFNGFDIKGPVITKVNQREVYAGYTFEIEGEGFHPGKTEVYVGDELIYQSARSTEKIVVELGGYADHLEGVLKVKVGPKEVESGNLKVLAPMITTSLLNKEVGPGEKITLKGQYLDNEFLEVWLESATFPMIEQEAEYIVVEVPRDQCKDFNMKVELKGETIKRKTYINLRNTTLSSEIKVLKNGNAQFGVYFSMEINDFSSASSYQLLLNNRQTWPSWKALDDTTWELIFSLPYDAISADGNYSLEFTSCNFWQKIENFYQAPKPVIDPIGVLQSFEYYVITGQGLNAQLRKIYIDGVQFEVNHNHLNYTYYGLRLPFLENGTHRIMMEVQGQRSEEVFFEVDNAWIKLTDTENCQLFDKSLCHVRPNFFVSNDKLYTSFSSNGVDNMFLEVDLNTGHDRALDDLPTSELGAMNGYGDYGYLISGGDFYRYDILKDQWEQLDSPDGIRETSNHLMSSFISNDKLFLFDIGGTNPSTYYYYDLITLEWHEMNNGPSHSTTSSPIKFFVGDGQVYLFQYEHFLGFDPINLQMDGTSKWFSYGGIDTYDLQGYIYNGELYILNNHGNWKIVDLTDWSIRYINGPVSGSDVRYVIDGDWAYVTSENEIWKYDLTKQ